MAAAIGLTVLATSGCMPIPPTAGFLFVPRHTGSAVAAHPIDSFTVPQHPHLASNGRSSMHNDAYATDAYSGPGPLGRHPKVTSATHGIEECATLAFDRAGRLLGLCGDILGPELKLIDPESLAVLAKRALPGRALRLGVNPLEDLCGGAYFYLDEADRAVVATTNRQIQVIGEPNLSVLQTYELSSLVPDDDCLIALMPDWSGWIWFETAGGRVGTVDPANGAGRVLQLLPGETIANSFAVDESGGVFVVSDHALYRLDADRHGAPQITWRQPYDRGARRKPGQLSQGSGTTPTLFSRGDGRGRVAITDNAEPVMNVLVFERDSGRFVCGVGVFEAGASATENSLVAVGDSLIAENNYGYTGPMSTMFGSTTTPGVAKVDVAGDRCSVAWTSPVIAPTSVPKASLASGLLYVYAKPPHRAIATWYFTAIDLRTGRTVFSVLTGTGIQWNNHYAAITLGPDGSAYVATIAGLVRIRDEPGR